MNRQTILTLLLVLLLVPTLFAVTKPPPLDPNEVPFAFDPNQVTSPLLDYLIGEPNTTSIATIGWHDKYGLDCDLTITDMTDPNSAIITQYLGRFRDNGGGWNRFWQYAITTSVEGVHYVLVTAADKHGRSDSRTIVALFVSGEQPFLFIGQPPVSMERNRQSRKFTQYAKKWRPSYHFTEPTNVWR